MMPSQVSVGTAVRSWRIFARRLPWSRLAAEFRRSTEVR